MNLKRLIFVLLVVVILTSTTSIIFAQEVKLSDISFDVPANFTVKNTSDVSARLVREDSSDYAIFIFESDSDSNIAQRSNAVTGFTFLDGGNYTSSNGIHVIQQNYIKNESYFSYYSFNVSDSHFLIGYSFPVHGDFIENEQNPVDAIIESIR
ncbi:hypothetical protein [Methanobrevibacter sp.]